MSIILLCYTNQMTSRLKPLLSNRIHYLALLYPDQVDILFLYYQFSVNKRTRSGNETRPPPRLENLNCLDNRLLVRALYIAV